MPMRMSMPSAPCRATCQNVSLQLIPNHPSLGAEANALDTISVQSPVAGGGDTCAACKSKKTFLPSCRSW
eukprot:CAMPEP_0181203138 /NCGR_PEP_ID=MMETSP1096-20121128/19222_1 /TAXON_ID=156174 ORGANISM="Chrysochromulina ericina, Strain CCMP281" /NCGR_SAMPLE_ID=MMETSP1096 /ASSEMBLY_ACC=CAM_ASM_000453 /LENGTH=69 /DNA_ID=CAMNT_0023293711 /DNA_START=823 /DNA_END=1032 /DNA_ORIENTATION=-